MRLPFRRQLSEASIRLAVSDSPDGPWMRQPNNPIISPGEAIDAADGFLCDDTVFVVRDDKIWLYYKGYPRIEKEGIPHRAQGTTFILAATADKPEGPYEKISKVLHTGHEAALWKDVDSIGSLCTAFGPSRYYKSADGINFKSMHTINPLKAVGLYRADFEEGNEGTRATWGVTMELKKGKEAKKTKGGGLQRFESVLGRNSIGAHSGEETTGELPLRCVGPKRYLDLSTCPCFRFQRSHDRIPKVTINR